MANTITIKSEKYNATFLARFVTEGDRKGINMQNVHEGEPIVEIYDTDHPFVKDPEGNVLGQVVSVYFASTLLEGRIDAKKTYGLDLHGGVEKWTLDAPAFNKLHDAIVGWMADYDDEQVPSAPRV